MPNPFPIELRERAVSAYESGNESHIAVAERFGLNPWTLLRWVLRRRDTGTVAPLPKRGGWTSPVDVELLEHLVRTTRDATTEELTREYNRRVPLERRVHRSSILRALHRQGYVFKKNVRGPQNTTAPTSKPSARRSAWAARVDPARLCLWTNLGQMSPWAARTRG